jgi:hypothetical protein
MFAIDNDGAARDADWRHPERTWQPTVPAPWLGLTVRIDQPVDSSPR